MTILNVKEIYNDLHQIPELGLQEYKTSAYLAEAMEKLGYEVTRNVGGTGVVAIEKGEEEGPVLLLRADMDALPYTIDGKHLYRGRSTYSGNILYTIDGSIPIAVLVMIM